MHLAITGISKQYSRTFWGLTDLSVNLSTGILGLLGPNGAGKSTLMRIIATVMQPSSGSILLDGTDILREPEAMRRVLGYLPQDFGVYPHLTADEFLRYLAAIRGVETRIARRRIDELLAVTNLTDARTRPLGGYSGGMRQRLGIAQALLNDPRVLIVDEPTVGLDPEERVRFRNLLVDLSGERIVILSTHIVSDVEATATSIAVIARGTLLTHTAPETLLRSVAGKVWEWTVPAADLPAVRAQHLVSSTIRRPEGVQARIVADRQPSPTAVGVVPTLEDAYLHFTTLHAPAVHR